MEWKCETSFVKKKNKPCIVSVYNANNCKVVAEESEAQG